MSVLDTIKNLMKNGEDEEEIVTETLEPSLMERRKKAEEVEPEPKGRNRVVNIHATAQLQVVLVKPERFDDASTIADHLLSKRTVVLNLESTNKEVSRRLIDFLSGVAYANNGQIKRVANSTFIITPYNVDFMGDLLDELENNGVFF
jgi:cell division inhibitor SepF